MCSFSAAGAVGKRTRPLSGITENARGWKRRCFFYVLMCAKCVQATAAAQQSPYPGVAQLVARLLWEQDAAGSNPVTRTKSLKNRLFRRFFCVSGVSVSAHLELSVLLYTAPAMMEPYRKGRCGSCFTTANEVIERSFIRKAVFSFALLAQRPPFAAITTSASASRACCSISPT